MDATDVHPRLCNSFISNGQVLINQFNRGDSMRITTEVTTVVLVNGEELRGDKFYVEFKGGSSQTFRNTTAEEVYSDLVEDNRLADVVYFSDC
jgi:hypothetical protein